jgi:hypothetical protein
MPADPLSSRLKRRDRLITEGLRNRGQCEKPTASRHSSGSPGFVPDSDASSAAS